MSDVLGSKQILGNADQIHPHAQSIESAFASWGTRPEFGLSEDEVVTRRCLFGLNKIVTEQSIKWHHVLIRQYSDFLIAILFAAAIVSAAVGETTDAIAILCILVLNGLLGFFQEWKAERSLAALRQMLEPRCQVIREGKQREIDAIDLVPGDLVRIETGDRVPADLRIVQCSNLKLDESALTGESSSPVKSTPAINADADLAERYNMAWAGTAATDGWCIGIAVATAAKTEFGRIAELSESIDRNATPLQVKLSVLGRQLGLAAIVISIIVAITGWLMDKPPMEMLFTSISLAVAVVPEGLPAVVTLTLALGVREMIHHNVLLRRLRGAEGLGAATVICTDKTGTLTQNQMTVTDIWLAAGDASVTGVGYQRNGHFEAHGKLIDPVARGDLIKLMTCAAECCNARLERDVDEWIPFGSPTESAILVAANKADVRPMSKRNRSKDFSFTSTRKRMSVLTHVNGNLTAHTKGAPEVVLSICERILDGTCVRELTSSDRRRFMEAYENMAKRGLRTLAISTREMGLEETCDEETVESKQTLLGILGIMDPPRPEVTRAIDLAKTAGIKIYMITGDSPVTACAIANQIGLAFESTIIGSQLEKMNQTALVSTLVGNVIFARTTPEHKLRIVSLLQSQGHIVAMTGDGVNDAPALKKADIGIAMGRRGTEVAKGAADIILTDDNFTSIVDAVKEGRRQYDNIQKFVRYLLSSNLGEVVAIFANILIGGPLLFLPVQILWMNLVTDGMTAVALGLEPPEKNSMQRPPRPPSERVLTRSAVLTICALGSYVGLASLWLFHHYLDDKDPNSFALAQTVAFTGIIVIEKVNVLNFRSLTTPLWVTGFWSNNWVLAAILFTVTLQILAVYSPVTQNILHTVPLEIHDWLLIFAVSLPVFLVAELIKIGSWLKATYWSLERA